MTISWRRLGRSTTLRSIHFVRLPSRATVSITCRGRGCPARRWSARPGRAGALVRRLRDRVFRAGDRLTITIRVPGEVAERALVRIRPARRPLAALV